MKPVLLLLALAALVTAWVLCFGVGGEPRVAPSVATAKDDHAAVSRGEIAKLEGEADRERRAAGASAVPSSASESAAEGAPTAVVLQPEPPVEVAYSEPTELVHFALENTPADFEGKYSEQGKEEFTANLRSLESFVAMQRSPTLDENSRLDPQKLEIIESRVTWMQAFATKFR